MSDRYFPDSLISVREDEPSTVIAFALGSKLYEDALLLKQSGCGIEELLQNIDPRYAIELDDHFADQEESHNKLNGQHIRYRKAFDIFLIMC